MPEDSKSLFFRRLRHYEGKMVDVTEAANSSMVRALHDQAFLSVGLVAAGMALWQAQKEWKRKTAGETEKQVENPAS